jgi:hypothetical protein
MAAASDEVGISATTFFIAAAVIVAGIGAAVWFAIPGADTRHTLNSPSGKALLDIGEQCSETACTRLIFYEHTLSDGRRERMGCPIEIAGLTPIFSSVTATWSADESSVTIDYADAVGKRGEMTVVPAADCPVTQ